VSTLRIRHVLDCRLQPSFCLTAWLPSATSQLATWLLGNVASSWHRGSAICYPQIVGAAAVLLPQSSWKLLNLLRSENLLELLHLFRIAFKGRPASQPVLASVFGHVAASISIYCGSMPTCVIFASATCHPCCSCCSCCCCCCYCCLSIRLWINISLCLGLCHRFQQFYHIFLAAFCCGGSHSLSYCIVVATVTVAARVAVKSVPIFICHAPFMLHIKTW